MPFSQPIGQYWSILGNRPHSLQAQYKPIQPDYWLKIKTNIPLWPVSLSVALIIYTSCLLHAQIFKNLKSKGMYGLSSSSAFVCKHVITMFEQSLRKLAVARRSAPFDQEDSLHGYCSLVFSGVYKTSLRK
jgi:hypothetical protein